MDQNLINWLLGGFGALIGFLLKTLWQSVSDLREADKTIAEKVSEIEILVAGGYVKKEEFSYELNRLTNALFAKLDRIEDKMDKKADK